MNYVCEFWTLFEAARDLFQLVFLTLEFVLKCLDFINFKHVNFEVMIIEL